MGYFKYARFDYILNKNNHQLGKNQIIIMNRWFKMKYLFYLANYCLFMVHSFILWNEYKSGSRIFSEFYRRLINNWKYLPSPQKIVHIFILDTTLMPFLAIYGSMIIIVLIINYFVFRGIKMDQEEKCLFQKYSKVYSFLQLFFSVFSMLIIGSLLMVIGAILAILL